MRKKVILLSLVLGAAGLCCFGGCVSTKVLVDGVLGHYPHFDAVEYGKAVEIEIIAQDLVNSPIRVNDLLMDTRELTLYVTGRPYNDRILKEIQLLEKVATELKAREDKNIPMSKAYLKDKTETLVKLSDNLRKTIGLEKL